MNVNQVSTPVVAQFKAPAQTQASANPEVAVQQDKVEVRRHKELDEKNFSWLDLGKGLAGSVVGAAVDGVAMTASSVPLAAKAIVNAEKALYKTEMLGLTLKCVLAPVVALAGVAAIPLVAVGSIGYGLFSGFVKGAEENPLAVVGKGLEDTQTFNKTVGKYVTEGLQELAEVPLPQGQKKYDINVVEGAVGLVSGTLTGLADGASGALLTAAYGPKMVIQAETHLLKSDAAIPLKVGGAVLLPLAYPLGVVAAAIGGTVYGAGKGVKDGYTDGFGSALANCGKDVKEAASHLHKWSKEGF
jgi:hypothetical protein